MELNKAAKKTYVVTLLLLMGSVTFFPLWRVTAEDTTLLVEPQSTKIWGVGEFFVVNVKVADVIGLYGWQLKLYYNPKVLNGTGITEGQFLKSQGETFFNFTLNDKYNATYGLVTAFCTLIGELSGANGTGILLTITFQTKSTGNSLLDLEETILGDKDSNMISHNVIDGAVQVVPKVHDIAIESLIASSGEVVNGQIVEIYVIAANRGNLTETFNVTAYYNETVIGYKLVSDLSPGETVAITYIWDTTDVTPNATCLIRAEASPVPGETSLENNIYEGVTVKVVSGIHDIAVLDISCSSESTYKGRIVNIYVTVKNQGNYTEVFNLTVYGNETVIETRSVNLQYGETKKLEFFWNTTDAVINATYILKAVADLVSGEENSQNNQYVDGSITVYPPGFARIEIVNVTPSDEFGSPKNSFKAGTTSYLKVTVRSTSFEAENILLTINLYDAQGSSIGLITFSGPIGPGTSTFMPGFPIPKNASPGTASVYVNALTDWPHLGGVPYCPEKTAIFEVVEP